MSTKKTKVAPPQASITRHAKLMAHYAKDAAATPEPWKLWEHQQGKKWIALETHPLWAEHIDYRRVEMLGEINGETFPLGLQFAPEEDTRVYFPTFENGHEEPSVDYRRWDGDDSEVNDFLLKHRMAYLEEEDALKRARAMVHFREVRSDAS